MRKFYITISAIFLLCIAIFLSSFFFIDMEKHKVYSYIINLDGRDIGTIKVNRFITENKRLYKSVSDVPFYPVYTSFKSKIVLDNNYNLL